MSIARVPCTTRPWSMSFCVPGCAIVSLERTIDTHKKIACTLLINLKRFQLRLNFSWTEVFYMKVLKALVAHLLLNFLAKSTLSNTIISSKRSVGLRRLRPPAPPQTLFRPVMPPPPNWGPSQRRRASQLAKYIFK